MILSCIVAVSKNNIIGKKGTLPWKLSSDLKRFRQITSGHHIVLGRKNYEDIGRAVPDRVNLVLSRQKNFSAPGCIICGSLLEAVRIAQEANESELFIIGGAEVYARALPLCDKLYLTRVEADIEGDVSMPSLGENWKMVSEEKFLQDEKNEYPTRFQIFERTLSKT